jgi:coenzyme F420-reducing hydrogenase delta subunit
VAYIGGHHATAAEWQGQCEAVAGVAEIYLTSAVRLSVSDLLTAFERGADRVLVITCHEGKDRFPKATQRVLRRVEQARQLLAEVGMDADRLQAFQIADEGREAIRAVLVEAAQKPVTK